MCACVPWFLLEILNIVVTDHYAGINLSILALLSKLSIITKYLGIMTQQMYTLLQFQHSLEVQIAADSNCLAMW